MSTGDYNYYEQDKNKGDGTLTVDLDKVDAAPGLSDRGIPRRVDPPFG